MPTPRGRRSPSAGAPHSFFDRKYEEYEGACADAWRRVIEFLQKVGAARAA
jgi:carboxymethylenebutenolidase